jgi:predicted SAM-dependent methyltransferase
MTPRSVSGFTNVLARGGITAAAMGLFLFVRPDYRTSIENIPNRVRLGYHTNVTSPAMIRDYLHNTTVRKLQIGAGTNNYSGWLNSDIEPLADQVYLDAVQPFPLPDNSFQYVFSEHVIEHLTYEQAAGMLKECHRILAPGGKIRIATPNLLKLVELFREPASQDVRQYIERKEAWHEWPATPDPACFIINNELRGWGHQFVYTPKMLRGALEGAGFSEVKEFQVGQSDDAVLAGIEARGNWPEREREVNARETMILEAVRK